MDDKFDFSKLILRCQQEILGSAGNMGLTVRKNPMVWRLQSYLKPPDGKLRTKFGDRKGLRKQPEKGQGRMGVGEQSGMGHEGRITSKQRRPKRKPPLDFMTGDHWGCCREKFQKSDEKQNRWLRSKGPVMKTMRTDYSFKFNCEDGEREQIDEIAR